MTIIKHQKSFRDFCGAKKPLVFGNQKSIAFLGLKVPSELLKMVFFFNDDGFEQAE